MNLELIIYVIIGFFIYDVILKTVSRVLIKMIFTDDELDKQIKKTFDEKIDELKTKKK